MPDHAGLRERERGEDSERVQRDHARDARTEDDDHDARGGSERDDPVREHEAMTTLRQLARHERVAGVEAREPREIGERRVGREDQDQCRGDSQRKVKGCCARQKLRDQAERGLFPAHEEQHEKRC